MTVRPGDPDASPLLEFAEMMRHLRVVCPWKADQTHATLSRHLVEETYETLEALEVGEATGDWSPLRDELGDLLLQVYFHAVLAEERGEFTLDDVAAGISAKMVRRNPHVFGAQAGEDLTPAQVNELWQEAKAREKADSGELDSSGSFDPSAGLPPGLPALLWADKVAERAERAGRPFEATESPDVSVGERLLGLVLEARASGVDPEQALRSAVRDRLRNP